MNSANANAPTGPSDLLQFQRLQEQVRAGRWAEALESAASLQRIRLSPLASSLVLQLEGDAQRGLGEGERARELWRQSLQHRFSPQLALALLEQELLPVPPQSPAAPWLELMRRLVQQGHGAAVLRLLAEVLAAYPLQQLRETLLDQINAADGLQRDRHPQLQPPWRRIETLNRQAAAAG